MPKSLVSVNGGLLVVGGGLAAADDPCDCCNTGSCCFLDKITGAYTCTENVNQVWCNARPYSTFYPGQPCGSHPCPPTGACVIQYPSGIYGCTDGVTDENCNGSWFMGKTCDEVLTGACCGNDDCYEGVSQDWCRNQPDANIFYPGQACADTPCTATRIHPPAGNPLP